MLTKDFIGRCECQKDGQNRSGVRAEEDRIPCEILLLVIPESTKKYYSKTHRVVF